MMLTKIYDFYLNAGDLLAAFKDERYVFLLESSLKHRERGRFSILGFDPFYVYQRKGRRSLRQLKKEFEQFKIETNYQDLPFRCGLVGYLGYDYGLYQEKIKQKSVDDLGLPDCVFGFYDASLIIDHLNKKLIVTSSGLPEKDVHLKQAKAKERLKTIEKKLSKLESFDKDKTTRAHAIIDNGSLKSNFTKEQYVKAVKKALAYIKAGDIYQVNLSQRFVFEPQERTFPYEIYQSLSRMSPSSFGGYFDAGRFQIISSSPERFLHVNKATVHTRPMKGTRPRGNTREEDEKYKREIVLSVKDRAELLMITDLERNDLGRVCEYGSVRVKDMRSIEEYKTVYQATSTVEGKLRKDKDCFNLIEACFPGGSITGCPKLRAMEIIEELEPTRRGIYTGSMGYIDFNGNMDLNILIRTLLMHKNKVYFQVGGGIVADSTPEGEYQETLIKAKAMKDALYQMKSSLEIPAGNLSYSNIRG